jgi:hypothetical protein
MTNLHYESLAAECPDLTTPPGALHELTTHQLEPFRKYLERARFWLDNQTLEIEWEEASSPERSDFVIPLDPLRLPQGALAKDGLEPNWVRLKEPEGEDGEDILDQFLDTPFLFDAPRRGKRLLVHQRNIDEGVLLVSKRPPTNKLYYVRDTTVVRRQQTALTRLQEAPLLEYRGLLRLMEIGRDVVWPGVTLPQVQEDEWQLLKDARRSGTDEQRRFVQMALGTPDFAVLIGPPGSGKTITICEYILQELHRGHRVLLCASTHVAVDNVLEKLKEKGLTENQVIAVRVGDEGRVSDVAKDFLLKRWVERERAALMKHLESVQKRTPSQDFLLAALKEDGEQVIQRLMLECANLICGTTTGILSHPDLHDWNDPNKSSKPCPPPPYDVLVVDECSKTTFPEFLVPALLAKKWILVGDHRQLSPYVDTGFLQANLNGIVPKDDGAVCAPFLDAPPRSLGLLLSFATAEDREKAKVHAEGLHLRPVILDKDPVVAGSMATLDLWGSDVGIIAPEHLQRWERFLPPDMIDHTARRLPLHSRRNKAWRKERQRRALMSGPRPVKRPSDETEAKEWSYEVAWRLTRAFELRGNPQLAKTYNDQVEMIIPRWYPLSQERDGNGKLFHSQSEIRDNLDLVYRATFPSILEILQEGIPALLGTERSQRFLRDGSALQVGLREDLEGRRVTLSYQHRMHPEISSMPRELVYLGEALNDADGIETERRWPRNYPRYSSRACWFDVQGEKGDKNENLKEVDALLGELRAFRTWCRTQPPPPGRGPDGMWKVAVLTFYVPQERRLRYGLQNMFGGRNLHRFVDKDAHLEVNVATVDRFQGQEADVVLLSMVRTYGSGVGFLDNPNRVNVALTRAKYQLVVFGNQRYFESARATERAALCRAVACRLKGPIGLGGREA